MNIVKTFDQFDNTCIYFCEPIKNNIINDGTFIRIIYSTPNFSLNGINLLLTLNNVAVEKYYNKYKYSFNINAHRQLIENIKHIEETILQQINIKHKIPQYKIYEQVKNGNIKIFSENTEKINYTFMLKISGIWEMEQVYGLTYKFIRCNR